VRADSGEQLKMADQILVGPIERGIPVPARHSTASKGYSKALQELASGESRVLPVTMTQAQMAARHALGRGNYMCRTVDGGVRIWRLK